MTTGVLATPPILSFAFNNGQLASGGLILTTVGGVNTATYQDVGLTIPLPNPIPLNSRGEISNAAGASCQLFMTPNIVYTLTFYDGQSSTTPPYGNQIWSATYVNGVQISLTQALIGAALYPQTAAEIAAGVTPVNFAYAPGYIDRYSNIQQAVNGAGTTGQVFITADYAGTDTYTNPNNIPVTDYRSFQNGVWSVIAPGLNVTSGGILYPEGNDLVLRAAGPGDVYAEHLVVAATTTASLSIGANANVLVSTLTVGNQLRGNIRTGTTALYAHGAGLGLIVGRGQTNEEFIPNGSWLVVDGTHLSFTCANTHSGTTTIEQLGATVLATRVVIVGSYMTKSSQETVNPSMQFVDVNGSSFLQLPSDTTAAAPVGTVQLAVPLTGINSGTDLLLQTGSSAGFIRFRSNTGATVGLVTNAGGLGLAEGIGLFGAGAVTTKPTLTGAKGGNVALANLITLLATYGLLTDSTT